MERAHQQIEITSETGCVRPRDLAAFGTLQRPTRFEPLSWHMREILFGFVMAARRAES